MTDLDDALRDHVAAWTRDEAPPPDLDAALIGVRTTRWRRWPTLLAAAACVLVVAAVAVLLALRTDRHTTVASPPITRSSPSPIASATAPTAAVITELRRTARRTANLNGESGVITAEAVASAHGGWILQLAGRFVCGQCSSPSGAQIPKGRVVTFELRASRIVDFTIGPEGRNLARLGTVVRLGTIRGTGAPDTLSQQANDIASANGDANSTAQAVRTTLVEAEQATNSGSDNVPNRPVWLIQVRGQFECHTCKLAPGAKEPTGRFITLIVDVKPPYATSVFGLGNQETDLAKLGRVVTLLP
jgi:hypothetical protein